VQGKSFTTLHSCQYSSLFKSEQRYDDSEYPIPDDIPAFLEQVQPHIEVTEEGRQLFYSMIRAV